MIEPGASEVLPVDGPTPSPPEGERSPVPRALVALFGAATFATSLGAALPIGSGSSSLGGFDVLIGLGVVALARHRGQRFPRSAMVTWALILLLLGLSMTIPVSPHFVIRSAGMLLLVQVLRMDGFLRQPVMYGFLAGAVGQVAIGFGGYAYARSTFESDDAFVRLADYRALFDWLAGPTDQPPLSASGLMRMQALAGHPNELAAIVAIGALLTLFVVRNRAARWLVFGVLCLGTMFTLSRFAIVAVVAGVLLRPAGRTGLPGRIFAILAVGGAAILSLNDAVRTRLFDVRDDENARGRSAGPLDLLDDATFLPDGVIEVRHNSIAFMLDQGGLLLGIVWIALVLLGLYRIIRPTLTRAFVGTWLSVAFLFLTEDRIQSPSFLLVVVAAAATGFDIAVRRAAPVDAGARPPGGMAERRHAVG